METDRWNLGVLSQLPCEVDQQNGLDITAIFDPKLFLCGSGSLADFISR